ncbi:MAG: nucleoside kinase [Marinifilaceae bacterium]
MTDFTTQQNKITVFCENNDKSYKVPGGTTLLELKKLALPDDTHNIVGALINNQTEDLFYAFYKPKSVKFIDIKSLDGMSIYKRSLIFLLYTAVKQLYPRQHLSVEYFISNGTFCRIGNSHSPIKQDVIDNIKQRMQELVAANLWITKNEILTVDAVKRFNRDGLKDKGDLLLTRGKLYTSVYKLDGVSDYYYGTLAPCTGCLSRFDLIPYRDGMLLCPPDPSNTEGLMPVIPQDKLFNVFREHKEWGKILNVQNIGDLNRMIEHQEIGTVIKVSEALHEKKISQIADMIKKQHRKLKIIMIAGPSSSGKTTFGKRLSIQLLVNGITPINLSLDNYFVNREHTPKDEFGEYDFEAIGALDLETFSKDMNRLLNGEEIEIPKFSFETGQRFYDGEMLQIENNNVIIVEGIHGLNPALTELLPQDKLFKIFISALTSISIDKHNIISPSDNRLIRRLVRDAKYRNYSAVETIKRWDSVLLGEHRNIIPYQEEADVMFNTALIYELGVLKQYAEPLLNEVLSFYPEHSKAQKLLKFFSYFKTIPTREIPPTSLLREFLGGSSFKY